MDRASGRGRGYARAKKLRRARAGAGRAGAGRAGAGNESCTKRRHDRQNQSQNFAKTAKTASAKSAMAAVGERFRRLPGSSCLGFCPHRGSRPLFAASHGAKQVDYTVPAKWCSGSPMVLRAGNGNLQGLGITSRCSAAR
ncbi:hypothetical protein GCM10009628_26200 [Paeniglutamicibacter kerguelensis]